MATASELVNDPNLDIEPITAQTASGKGYTHDEMAHYRIGHADMHNLIIEIYNYGDEKGNKKKKNLRPFVTDATFEDTIDQTPTLTLSVHDPDWEILNSGALKHNIDINPGKLPELWYRLSGYDVNDDDITLTFSTRNANYLASHKRPHKANRKHVTRAQFILSLVRAVKKEKIKFICPQLKKRQAIAKTTDTERRAKRENREKGFTDSDKITVKHQPATEAQRRVIEKVISAGEDVGAPGLVIVAAVMTITIESEANENAHAPGNPTHWGAFQQDPRYWTASMARTGKGDAYKDAKGAYGKQGFYDAAIANWKKNPNQDLGKFIADIQGVTGSSNPANFGYAMSVNRWRDEAQHAVNAYGGVDIHDPGSVQTVGFRKKFEFMVGPPDGDYKENYMAAIYRLADEVNWSAFWIRGALHFQSEEDLFKSKARARLRRNENGVESVNFTWDGDKKLNQMILSTRMVLWPAPIGTVVVFDEGGPAQGRWLVTGIRRSAFDELGEITLMKPMNEKKEPANEKGTRTVNPKSPGPGDATNVKSPADLGGIEVVKESWTPKQVIDRLVAPRAAYHKMLTGISPAMIVTQNAGHSGTSATTMHKGPPYYQWAADMSNVPDGGNPTPQMDDLAADLIIAFNLPDFANPRATRRNGLVINNLVEGDHKGFHFQLIYRTDLGAAGGDHYDHVHFGLRKVGHRPAHNQ